MSLLRSVLPVVVIASLACHHSSETGPTEDPNVLTVTVDSGSNAQFATVGHAVHVTVTASKNTGSPVPGQTARWNVEGGGGTLSSSSTVTDADGRTGVDWTLGTLAGLNTVTVTIGGGVAVVLATGTADTVKSLNKISTDTQTVVASASTPIVARAVDAFGNGVQGVIVAWSATGGSVTPATTTTGTSGNAQATFTSPTTPGTFTITAAVPGLNSLTFVVVTH